MTITIEKLRIQIQKAKAQLLSSAQLWLTAEEGLNSDEKIKWLEAVQSLNSDDMHSKLREANLSLERVDQCRVLPSTDSELTTELSVSKEPIKITRRFYEVSSNKGNNTLSKLCHLTTLFEQLHHLEESLTPFELPIPFNSLKLAHEMACSIAKEWRFVEPGIHTVDYYKQRAAQALAQLQFAQGECTRAFQLLEAPLEIKLIQFAETLCFIADCLTQSYTAEQDDRFFVEFWKLRLRSYLPWQQMINDLTLQLFETSGFTHPSLNTLEIQKERVRVIIDFVDNQTKKPFTEQQNESLRLSQIAEGELTSVCKKIEYMENSNNVRRQLGEGRVIINALMSTQRFGFFSLYQVLHAYHGRKSEQVLLDNTPNLLNTSEERVETAAQLSQ